ncbi:hypothetical protein DSUL_60280 [Desulfovibrionales bacterium]
MLYSLKHRRNLPDCLRDIIIHAVTIHRLLYNYEEHYRTVADMPTTKNILSPVKNSPIHESSSIKVTHRYGTRTLSGLISSY